MPQSDPLTILLPYDRWATGQLMAASEKLTPEQFHHRFDMGPGSLHDTLLHILGAMRNWTQVLHAQEPAPRLEQSGQRTPAELLALLDAVTKEFASEAARLPLSDTVSRTRDGKTFQFTRGSVLMQLMTHGVHHRAQCLNMLKQLGVKPLPYSSVTEWTRFGETV